MTKSVPEKDQWNREDDPRNRGDAQSEKMRTHERERTHETHEIREDPRNPREPTNELPPSTSCHERAATVEIREDPRETTKPTRTPTTRWAATVNENRKCDPYHRRRDRKRRPLPPRTRTREAVWRGEAGTRTAWEEKKEAVNVRNLTRLVSIFFFKQNLAVLIFREDSQKRSYNREFTDYSTILPS